MTTPEILSLILNAMYAYDSGGCKFEISYDDATFEYVICTVAYGPNGKHHRLGSGRSLGEAFKEAQEKLNET